MGGRGSRGRALPQAGFTVGTTTPPPEAPEPTLPIRVSGALSDEPLAENGWGYDPNLPVSYHDHGPIGTAIRDMGTDARMDIDGEPLANVLGKLATDINTSRKTAQQGLDDFKAIRDRLPQNSQARTHLTTAICDMDAPPSPIPHLPAAAPTPLHQLAEALNNIPILRNDPSREIAALQRIAEDFAAGRGGGLRMINDVRRLANQRHESLGECGKFEIDRAIRTACDALRNLPREALRPPRPDQP